MLDLMLTGGVVVALAGVVQAAARWKRDSASAVALLREGMAGLEGSDAEAVRAEFRQSGVILPEPHRPAGFF
ncbi:MAG TPA: hypothetical protein VHO73_12255 [Methylomirabilota bacterium]|jgi:hypothetical protein|nr:hypothetical protein [Methylomirabilota bacterium]